MRVSIFDWDPGYVSDPWNYRVLLDGHELDDCATADSAAGTVWCWNGNLACGIVTLTGLVTVVRIAEGETCD